MKISEESIRMIRDLSNAPGASGFEDEVIRIAAEYGKDYADISEDKLRNLYLERKGNTGGKPRVMLEAHSDEVGFMVQSIRPNGTLRVVNLGHWTNSVLPSSKVLIRTSDGTYIPGVFAARPVHFGGASTAGTGKDLPISELSIDIGASSRQEAEEEFGIRIGEPIVPATLFELDNEHGIMFGKAFDCRIGCAALLEIMKRISGENLPCDVIGVLSSQEELGERGCRVSVEHVRPDVAICLEGCPADDTFADPYAVQAAMGKGTNLRHMDVSVVCSPRLQRFVLDLAHRRGVAVQESVREGGGNDAAAINLACGGIPVVTASIPVRYIHSMNCIASYCDYETTAQLVCEVLKNLTQEVVEGL